MINMLSIIIPARNEKYLNKTVEELLAKAASEIEIIIVLDGYWDVPVADPRVRIIHRGKSRGMRNGINSAVAIAQGKYIMKIDAHCMVGQGYDVKLKADCEKNWVVVPRRKRLDPENWKLIEGRPDIDYMYLSSELKGEQWKSKNEDPELKKIEIDDLMSSQGSCWFMHREYFYELELMDEENYGSFIREFQEIGLKCWLSGGRVIVNKKTWYAHWHKDNRGYSLSAKESEKGATYVKKWLTGEAWPKATIPFSWLLEKFNPPQ
jgi:glycosyltransferase involved in cell wall biosynthesis